MSPIRKLVEQLRTLYRAAKSERASPVQIGWAVGVGVFAGCTPAIGFHGALAIAMATMFRLNRLFAFLGSRVSAFFIMPWIIMAEVEVAHRIRTGAWVAIDRKTAVERAAELLVDWLLGTIPVGGTLAVVLGTLAYVIARSRRSAHPEGARSP